MNKALLLCLAVVSHCFAQIETSSLRGELRTNLNLIGNRLQVELVEEVGHRVTERTHVANDGGCEVRHVPRGRYVVQLLNEQGDVLDHINADVSPSNMFPVTLTLRTAAQPKASSQTVSVARLRH